MDYIGIDNDCTMAETNDDVQNVMVFNFFLVMLSIFDDIIRL